MFIGQPLFIIRTSPVILSTLTEYFVYPATLLSSPALVRKEDTFTSSSGYDLISPALMFENASFKQPLRRPYFCLFFVVLIFFSFDCVAQGGIAPPLIRQLSSCCSILQAFCAVCRTIRCGHRFLAFYLGCPMPLACLYMDCVAIKHYSALRPTGLNTCEDCFTSRYQFSLFCIKRLFLSQ